MMLRLQHISKVFPSSTGDFSAVKDVSFSISENKVLALIGESGSGKSTIAEMIVGLNKPTEGALAWFNEKLDGKIRQANIQYIFQNPDRSLNPYWRIEDILLEPLLLKKVKKKDAKEKINKILEMVELPKDILTRFPNECSGGQKQRIAIGRTLTREPKLLIADEITSALDPVTEQAVIKLLINIKRNINMSILFITHRIHTAKQIADDIIVLKSGEIVEKGPLKDVLLCPTKEYTKRLIKSCNYRREYDFELKGVY